jgi:hypothetical protein
MVVMLTLSNLATSEDVIIRFIYFSVAVSRFETALAVSEVTSTWPIGSLHPAIRAIQEIDHSR